MGINVLAQPTIWEVKQILATQNQFESLLDFEFLRVLATEARITIQISIVPKIIAAIALIRGEVHKDNLSVRMIVHHARRVNKEPARSQERDHVGLLLPALAVIHAPPVLNVATPPA